MVTPEKTEEQKAKEAAAIAQQEADDKASRLVGEKPEKRQFTLMENITNSFVNVKNGKPDWMKLLVVALGAVAGGIFGADLGIIGILAAGAIGLALAGVAAVNLVPWMRGDKTNEPPPGLPLNRPFAPEANEKVIADAPVNLPAVAAVKLGQATVNIPVYDKKENQDASKAEPSDPKLREAIEDLRKIAESGNPVSDPANKHLRYMLTQLDNKENRWEMNMRYLGNVMPGAIKASSDKVDEYLNRIVPEAKNALSIGNVDAKDLPGRYAKLPDNLERYGELIKNKLLKDMADKRVTTQEYLGVESEKTIKTAWDNLSVVAKRNLISNFANELKKDARDMAVDDSRVFFPEHANKIPFTDHNIPIPLHLNYYDFSPFDSLEKQYKAAWNKHDFQAMADVLEKRLNADKDMPENSRLSKDAKTRMNAIILGFQAEDKIKELDAYIQNTVKAHDLPKLEKFEASLLEHNQRVVNLRSRMQSFAQSGGKYLVLEESKLENNTQTIKLLDARSSEPKTVSVEINFENGSSDKIQSVKIDGVDKTSALNDKTLPADDAGRAKKLQSIIESSDKLSALSQNVRQQVADVRGSTALDYANADTQPEASNAPIVAKTSSSPTSPVKGERLV